MTMRVPVSVHASDPISHLGIVTQLKGRPEVRVVETGDSEEAEVAVVVADDIDDEAVRVPRAVQRNGSRKVVVVATRVDETGLFSAVEAGAGGLLRRSEATTDGLVRAIESAAAGDGSVPPDLLGRLLTHVGRLQRNILSPRGFTFTGLMEREVEVLRLVAEGLDTGEIAKRLSYSERTIKNVIHDVVTRLNLRNRSHAVAYALREGLI
jgi:DNA-binding NarL/FixJ family response regulator